MQKINKKNMNYSFDIKLKAVKMYLEEELEVLQSQENLV